MLSTRRRSWGGHDIDADYIGEILMFSHRVNLGEKFPSVHNPPPRYNAGDNESSLSIFRGQLGSASDARYKTLNHEEWRHIMLYLLTNLSEVEPYIG